MLLLLELMIKELFHGAFRRKRILMRKYEMHCDKLKIKRTILDVLNVEKELLRFILYSHL